MAKGAVSSVVSFGLLRTYVRVVETGNISAAARSLFLAQSAVSAQMSALTRAVGIPLLERVRGKWEPTAAGALLYRRANEMIALLDGLDADIRDLKENVRGHLTLASTRTVTDTVLAELISGFRAVAPDVRVDILAGNRAEVERALAEDEADAALVAMPFSGKGLESHPFARDRLLLIVPAAHPLSDRPSVRFEEVEESPFVMFEQGAGTRGLLEERLGRRFSELDVRLSLNSNDALIAAVVEGLGFTFLPERSAAVWQKLGTVRALKVEDVDLSRDLALVMRSGLVHSSATVAFAEYVRGLSAFRDLR